MSEATWKVERFSCGPLTSYAEIWCGDREVGQITITNRTGDRNAYERQKEQLKTDAIYLCDLANSPIQE